MKNTRVSNKKTERKRISLLGILLIAVLVTAMGAASSTTAKYVLQDSKSTGVIPSSFYFSSDYLQPKANNAKYDIYGAKGFDITLFNSENGNSSTTDITYTVTVSGCTVTIGDASVTPGTILSSENSAIIKITPTVGINETFTVKVTTAPYNKELTATFTLRDDGDSSFYNYENKGGYGILTIKIGSEVPPSLTINYNSLAPDNTDERLQGWSESGHSVTLNKDDIKANATYTFIFFGEWDDIADTKIENGVITIGATSTPTSTPAIDPTPTPAPTEAP